MKKMPTLFRREFGDRHSITIFNEVTPGCEWAIKGEGVATRKLDGTCTLIKSGELWKRYDAKKGKPVPEGAIKCQENPDPITGHLPCWVKVDFSDKADKWMAAAFLRQKEYGYRFEDGTYELCGPHFQGNPECLEQDEFIKHGSIILDDVPRDFEGIKQYLFDNNIEGIVFHRCDGTGEMCKIKRTDFGFKWNNRNTKR